ncbi:DsbA family protein [Halorubrum luteum]
MTDSQPESSSGSTTDVAADSSPDSITVYSDYVCPFCYLGRASLALYRETRTEPLAVDWHPFDLRAGKRGPDGEIDHDVDDGKGDDYYEQARENVERLRERYDVEMAQSLRRDVDSLPAQLVSLHVKRERLESWPALDDAIFDALWVAGRDIGDREVLVDVAGDVAGVPDDVVDTALNDADLRASLEELFDAARRQGITGVPTFASDDRAARGAVPPEQLRRLVDGE